MSVHRIIFRDDLYKCYFSVNLFYLFLQSCTVQQDEINVGRCSGYWQNLITESAKKGRQSRQRQEQGIVSTCACS